MCKCNTICAILDSPRHPAGRKGSWLGKKGLASLTQLMFAKHWWKWARTANDKAGAQTVRQADAGSTLHAGLYKIHHSYPDYFLLVTFTVFNLWNVTLAQICQYTNSIPLYLPITLLKKKKTNIFKSNVYTLTSKSTMNKCNFISSCANHKACSRLVPPIQRSAIKLEVILLH